MTGPHRTPTSGSEVVQIVESAFSALRAERDEALTLLARIVAHPGASLPDHLAAEARQVLGT